MNQLIKPRKTKAALSILILAAIVGLAVSLVASVLLLAKGVDTQRLRIVTVVQDVFTFVLPPVLAAVLTTRLPARQLLINRVERPFTLLLVLCVAVVSIPAMNCLVAFNQSLHLPAQLAGLEQWMHTLEESASQSVDLLMGPPTVGSLVMALLIVALLAGFSEELFFRSGLQHILAQRISPNAAIWITAIVFSLVHMQFFGFIPRMLLGLWFGYLAWWSQSLWLPVTAHVANNAIVVCVDWLRRSGRLATDIDTIGASPSVTTLVSLVATIILIIIIYKMLDECRPNRPGFSHV